MAEQVSASKSPETLTLTVFRLRNLIGLRGENLSFMVRAEYNEKTLGESAKMECNEDGSAELNHTSSIIIAFDEYRDLDDLAHKPILLTLIEVLPKEKKQKEEKTITLGQCTVDMLPMLGADVSKHRITMTVQAVPGSPLEGLPAEVLKPEVDVQLSVVEPLISSVLASESTLINVTIESLYSPPDTWQLVGPQYMFVAAMPLPLTAEKDLTLVFGNGFLKPGVDMEVPNKQKKWLTPGANAQGPSVYIPDSFVKSEGYDKEDGDYKSKEEREHRVTSETDGNRVSWNTERRCYFEPASCKALQDRIAKNRVLPIEVIRVPMPSSGKTKKEDDYALSYHGVAFVNVARLLYPGVTKIKGAYKIHPFVEHEYQENSKRRQGVADEAFKIINNQLNRGAASPFPKKGGKEDKKADVKKGRGRETGEETSANVKSSEPITDLDAQQNMEGQGYVDSGSYLMIEIALSRPMVSKRQQEELSSRVSAYIPPRPSIPKRSNGAEKAVSSYHDQIASVAALVLEECRELYGETLSMADEVPVASAEEKRRRLIGQLNSSGKYFAFKEQLKQSVIKIVREKYLKTARFGSQEELQSFLSELYVYLIDQMHVALGKTMTLQDAAPAPQPLTTLAQLKHFAREAEVNEDFDLAAQLYQERIAQDKTNVECWLDYGTFCLHINDTSKAEECFKECVSIDQNHVHGLLLYGIVCALEERNSAATTFLEAATYADPKSVLAWTILSLFHDGIGNEDGAEAALAEAEKYDVHRKNAALLESHTASMTLSDEQAESLAGLQRTRLQPASVYMQSAEWLLEVKAVTFTERALGHELLTSSDKGPGAAYHIAMARLQLQKREMTDAELQLNEAIRMDPENVDAWSIMGHLKYLLGDIVTARDCYEKTLAFFGNPNETHSIYLRLASIYLQQGFFQEAKETFLSACKQSPSCISWLGVGIACYRLHECAEAEDALSEANTLSNSDAEVWGYLALVCFQTRRSSEAQQAYQYACQLGLKDEALLKEIHELRAELGFG